MNELIVSGLLDDVDKAKLNELDLFDRVINLKLITTEDDFVIRSDYEVVFPNQDVTKVFRTGEIVNGNYYIRKCEMKPSIKVHYKRVSADAGIEVDIYINNFYTFTSDGKTMMSFSDVTNSLQTVEIEMGYFGQFSKLPHDTFEDLQDLKQGSVGLQKIVCDVQYVTTDKLPPDSILHIHGWVGSILEPELATITAKTFSELQQSPLNSSVNGKGDDFIEKLLYTHITRRFPKHRCYRKSLESRMVNGLMTDEDANIYGILLFCSKGVTDLSIARAKNAKSADGKEVPKTIYYVSGDSARNVYNKINSVVGGQLCFKELVDGNWLVYTKSEAGNMQTLKQAYRELLATEGLTYYRDRLPAVYNISVAAQTTIVAPFFFFINPFETFYFKSRYMVSSLVNYYTDLGESKFTAIHQLISFATVDNVNEMTLLCNNE